MMKHVLVLTLTLSLGLSCFARPPARAPEEIQAVMNKATDWQIEHLRDDINRYHEIDNRMQAWTFAALWVGMLEWAEVSSGSESLYAFLKNMGDEVKWDLGWGKYNANEMGIGHLNLEMYRKFNDPKMLKKTEKKIRWILDNPSKQPINLNHYKHMERWTWADALFMAPPLYSKLSAITGDLAFNAFMFEEYKATTEHLFNPETGLFYRDEHYIGKLEHGREVYWSRGNGWVFSSLALIIPDLPEGEMKEWFVDLYQQMALAIAELQTDKGHWCISLLCDDVFPNPETSGSAFFVHGLAWGLNAGLLDREKYDPVVMKGWDSLVSHISDEGMLGYVQAVGEAPFDVGEDEWEVYGTGALLSAGAEVYKLAVKKKTTVFEVSQPDYTLSPETGMTRRHWKEAGVYLLEGAFSYVNRMEDPMLFPKLPGKSRGSVNNVSMLESMARTLFIAAPLMKEDPELTINGIRLADYYRHHIVALSDPRSPSYIKPMTGSWPGQTLVEFGALSISLFGSPEILWDPLTKKQQDALAETMNSYADGPTVDSNWKFFNIFVLSFLKSRGYEINEALLVDYLNKSLAHYRGDGWYNDNPCYDYYSMWAFQMYGATWAHYFGNEHYPDIAAKLNRNYLELLPNYPLMFSRDGEMIMWGRSITYRFAASSVFPLAAWVDGAEVDWGWLRRISSGNLLQFLQHPDFLKDRVPTLGFYGHFEPGIQEYLARGSSYWMGKWWVGLNTPADHPFWTATESDGSWDTLSAETANPQFFEGSKILQTDYTGIGASEIRAWCHIGKEKHDHGRSTENYNKLAYNSAFPWQADDEAGTAAMNFRFRLADGPWLSSSFYDFKSYENGIYRRTLMLEENPGIRIELAEMPLKNGMLRVDTNKSTVLHTLRLGHYALPHLDGVPCKTEIRTVDNVPVYLVSNAAYQLALVPLNGWGAGRFVVTEGLHPESVKSTVINMEAEFDSSAQSEGVYKTLMLWKPEGESWSDAELLREIQEAAILKGF
ncbi:DUF2264 domain-containing protein [Pontiellaceae bacterium B12227]|nr:DUF2264 domain-containing protein [Pontiellaceae bacterium B12227]